MPESRNMESEVKQRMLSVFEYAYENLSADLSVNALAEVAHLSPYHFHRTFRNSLGETVSSLVRRIRMHWAAYHLVCSSRSVMDIAQHVGYPNIDSFTRAFSRSYQMTPIRYRELYQAGSLVPRAIDLERYQLEQLDLDRKYLIGMPHYGDLVKIGVTFESLVMFLNDELSAPLTRAYTFYFYQARRNRIGDYQCVATLEVSQAEYLALQSHADTRIRRFELPSYQYNSLLHTGSYAELDSVYDWYRAMIRTTKHRISDANWMFEEYLDNPKTTLPCDLRTRIYWPISKLERP